VRLFVLWTVERNVMGMKLRSIVLAALAVGPMPSCGSSDSPEPPVTPVTTGPDSSVDAAPPEAAPGRDPNANCVKPGAPGNEKGVGQYCENGAQCAKDTFCTADFGALTPPDHWFCTMLCAAGTDCGSSAYCDKSTGTSACVPTACGPHPADAGAAD
jgi:hypothetical protein